MKGIDGLKEPGCDGLNVVFFKKAWIIRGEEVTEAILYFFATTEMFKAINCISIRLIPKVKNT